MPAHVNIHACRFVWPRVLLLECVKEVDDAFSLMEILHRHKLPLLQVGIVAAAM